MNKTNLLKFADLLEDYKEEFGLGVHDLMPSILEKCGFEREFGENWYYFSKRIFDLSYWSDEWHWCFRWIWMGVDPSAFGCATRIKILVNEGCPKNWREQMDGREPLMYNPEDLKLIKEIERVLQ